MKKIIRNIGNSLGFGFNKEEQRIHNIEEGDIADLTYMEIIKKEVLKDENTNRTKSRKR